MIYFQFATGAWRPIHCCGRIWIPVSTVGPDHPTQPPGVGRGKIGGIWVSWCFFDVVSYVMGIYIIIIHNCIYIYFFILHIWIYTYIQVYIYVYIHSRSSLQIHVGVLMYMCVNFVSFWALWWSSRPSVLRAGLDGNGWDDSSTKSSDHGTWTYSFFPVEIVHIIDFLKKRCEKQFGVYLSVAPPLILRLLHPSLWFWCKIWRHLYEGLWKLVDTPKIHSGFQARWLASPLPIERWRFVTGNHKWDLCHSLNKLTKVVSCCRFGNLLKLLKRTGFEVTIQYIQSLKMTKMLPN